MSTPHPYWLAVIPLAAGRGLLAGLTVAALASAVYAVGAHEALQLQSPLELLDSDVLLEPFLFGAVGFLLGEIHDVLADRERGFLARIDQSRDDAARHRRERDAMRLANRVLTARMVDVSVQFTELAMLAERIEGANDDALWEIGLELTEQHCGGAASVLLPIDDTVDIAAHRGWPDAERPRRLAAARDSEVVHTALHEGVVVNGLADTDVNVGDGPLVACPISDASGQVVALLTLDDISTSRLEPMSATTFASIAAWIEGAMKRRSTGVARCETRRRSPRVDGAMRVQSTRDLVRRVRLETERALRHGASLCVIVLQFAEQATSVAEAMVRHDANVLRHIIRVARDHDSVHRLAAPGAYAVVATGASDKEAGRLMRAFRDSLTRGGLRAGSHYSLEFFGLEPDVPDATALLQRVLRTTAAASARPTRGELLLDVPDRVGPGDVDDLARRVLVESGLARERGHGVHMLSIEAETPTTDDRALLRAVDAIAASTLRPLDTAYTLGPTTVAVVLPYSSRADADRVCERVVEALDQRDPTRPFGVVTAHVLDAAASTNPLALFDVADDHVREELPGHASTTGAP